MATIKPNSLTAGGTKIGIGFQKPVDADTSGENQTSYSQLMSDDAFIPAADATANKYYRRLIALSSSMSPIASFKNMPVELTGELYPTEIYKDGELFGGQVRGVPRLRGAFPWLVYAALGKPALKSVTASHTVGTITLTIPDGSTGILPYDDGTTNPSTIDETYLPWVSFVELLPDGTGTVGVDSLVAALEITVPQKGPVSFQASIIGKNGKLFDTSNTTDMTNLFASGVVDMISVGDTTSGYEDEDFGTVMMAGDAVVTATGVINDAKFYGIKLSYANQTTTPQEEQVMGAFKPDTFTVRRRIAQIQTTIKWKDISLAKEIMSGTSTGNEFSSAVAQSGSLTIELPTIDQTNGEKLTINIGEVTWQPNGPIIPDASGDGMLTQDYVGTVVKKDGTDYISFEFTTTQDFIMTTDNNSDAVNGIWVSKQ